MNIKKIIVMTESSKFKNSCVAGIDVNTGKWIRVVSDDEDTQGALTNDDLRYEDGTKCQVMDVVDIPYLKKVPTKVQPENILIDRGYYIRKDGVATLDDILSIHPSERHDYVFATRYSSVKEEYLEEQRVDYSLILIKVNHLVFSRKENNMGQLKLKAIFTYNNVNYADVSVTDPDFFDAEENDKIQSAYLVVSLGEPYHGNCYKFIAKIFPVE